MSAITHTFFFFVSIHTGWTNQTWTQSPKTCVKTIEADNAPSSTTMETRSLSEFFYAHQNDFIWLCLNDKKKKWQSARCGSFPRKWRFCSLERTGCILYSFVYSQLGRKRGCCHVHTRPIAGHAHVVSIANRTIERTPDIPPESGLVTWLSAASRSRIVRLRLLIKGIYLRLQPSQSLDINISVSNHCLTRDQTEFFSLFFFFFPWVSDRCPGRYPIIVFFFFFPACILVIFLPR